MEETLKKKKLYVEFCTLIVPCDKSLALFDVVVVEVLRHLPAAAGRGHLDQRQGPPPLSHLMAALR